MPLSPYALAVCFWVLTDVQAPQQVPPDPEMNNAIREFKARTQDLGLRPDSPQKTRRHSPWREWHGRVFENFRNDELDAVPHEIRQNGGDKGLLRRNQFGFNVAGPLTVPTCSKPATRISRSPTKACARISRARTCRPSPQWRNAPAIIRTWWMPRATCSPSTIRLQPAPIPPMTPRSRCPRATCSTFAIRFPAMSFRSRNSTRWR